MTACSWQSTRLHDALQPVLINLKGSLFLCHLPHLCVHFFNLRLHASFLLDNGLAEQNFLSWCVLID